MLRKVLILSVIYFSLITGLIYIELYKTENNLKSSIEFVYEGF